MSILLKARYIIELIIIKFPTLKNMYRNAKNQIIAKANLKREKVSYLCSHLSVSPGDWFPDPHGYQKFLDAQVTYKMV